MTSQIAMLTISMLMISSIYVLVALGFALVFSVMRILNFAHGAIYMIGGFVCYSFWVPLGLGPWLSLPLTMIITALFGLFIEKFCFRPFQKDFEKAIVMAIILVISLKTGADLTVGPSGKAMPSLMSGSIKFGDIVFNADRLMVLVIACVLLITLVFFIQKTKFGQAMLAIAHDRDGAALQGINTNRISALACSIGCALAGLAGGLMGSVLVLHVVIADIMLVKVIAVVILAGIGSIGGIWAGGLVMGVLDTFCPYFFPPTVSEPLGLGLIVLILVLKPRGFFGQEM
jgi:branched-chain amino acid transport system permease protein